MKKSNSKISKRPVVYDRGNSYDSFLMNRSESQIPKRRPVVYQRENSDDSFIDSAESANQNIGETQKSRSRKSN